MDKKKYYNLDDVSNTNTWTDIRKWQKERKAKKKDLSFSVPLASNLETAFMQQNRQENTITWIGHSTFLLQLAGLNIVIDPVWARRLGFANRLAPAGIPIDKLPNIDVVLITHSHYDHLHFGSIRKLKGETTFLIPSGLGRTFYRKGYQRIQEFEWWQTARIGDVAFTFVPAQHWSKRTLIDTNTSHWGGWMIQTVQHSGQQITIYNVGDTGYFRGFKDTGERFEIDYALMPIGAYEPEWFMAKQHVTPEEAIQGFLDCRAEYFIPMHYGAYRLADDTPKEALDRLYIEWQRRKLEPNRLITLARGETFRP